MEKKFWLLKLSGDMTLQQIESTVGAMGGLILKVNHQEGESRAYFTGEENMITRFREKQKSADAPTEVSMDDMVKL